MSQTLGQSIEEKVKGLTPEVAEQVLSEALYLREAKQRDFDAAIQEGLDDLENGRFTEIRSEEELNQFFDQLGKEVFDSAK